MCLPRKVQPGSFNLLPRARHFIKLYLWPRPQLQSHHLKLPNALHHFARPDPPESRWTFWTQHWPCPLSFGYTRWQAGCKKSWEDCLIVGGSSKYVARTKPIVNCQSRPSGRYDNRHSLAEITQPLAVEQGCWRFAPGKQMSNVPRTLEGSSLWKCIAHIQHPLSTTICSITPVAVQLHGAFGSPAAQVHAPARGASGACHDFET